MLRLSACRVTGQRAQASSFSRFLGLMILVIVTATSVPEQEGAKLVFAKLQGIGQSLTQLVLIRVNGGYKGVEFMRWVMARYGWIIETISVLIKRKDSCSCLEDG